jgi:hypothetical protein
VIETIGNNHDCEVDVGLLLRKLMLLPELRKPTLQRFEQSYRDKLTTQSLPDAVTSTQNNRKEKHNA